MSGKRTRSASGGGTIRRRKDGLWEARYTIGHHPGSGKQLQRSVYAKTQAECRRKLAQAVAALDAGEYQEPAKMPFGKWLDIWLEEYTGNLKPSTLRAYEKNVRVHIKPAMGAVKLPMIKAHTLQAFYNRLQKEGNTAKDGGLSPKTVRNIGGIVHKSLQQAVEIGYLKRNPANACKLPRWDRPELNPLDETGIASLFKAIKGHQFERVYFVDLFTGMRQGEILGLTWDSVDFEKGTIYVSKQIQRVKGEYIFVPLKNDKARTVTPASVVMQTLKDQKITQAEWRLRAGAAWNNEMNLIFTNELGRYLVADTVYKNFKMIVQSIGIPGTRFHDLRHSYAVAALQSGDDVKTVQEHLGHHTAAFTLDTYAHVTEKMRKESAARMDAFIEAIIHNERS